MFEKIIGSAICLAVSFNIWAAWNMWNKEDKYYWKHQSKTTADEYYGAFDAYQKKYKYVCIELFTWNQYAANGDFGKIK